MNNDKQGDLPDLVTPFIEVAQDIVSMTFKGLWMLTKFLYRKITNAEAEIKKIDRKYLKRKKTTQNSLALGVDLDSKKDILFDSINFQKHSFIVGASGFGKTNLITMLQEDRLKKGIPIIFIDPKGDLEALLTFKNLCRKYQRKCHIFSEYYPDSISLNPLLEGTNNQVCDRIMRAFDWSEQFYKDASSRALTKALKDLRRDEKDFTIKNINGVLNAKYYHKDIVGLIAKLESILESDFSPILNDEESSLTISKIRSEKSCLYVGLSAQGYGETAKSIGKLIFGDLMNHSYKTLKTNPDSHESMENPISVYFDEFGSLVVPEFVELLNKCRGAGIEITMSVQTPADINRVDPELTNQLLESSSNFFIFKQRLEVNATLFSEAIGTMITTKHTEMVEDGSKTGKKSEREVYESIVHPDVIKNLNVGQCILLRHSPTKVNLLNVRNRR